MPHFDASSAAWAAPAVRTCAHVPRFHYAPVRSDSPTCSTPAGPSEPRHSRVPCVRSWRGVPAADSPVPVVTLMSASSRVQRPPRQRPPRPPKPSPNSPAARQSSCPGDPPRTGRIAFWRTDGGKLRLRARLHLARRRRAADRGRRRRPHARRTGSAAARTRRTAGAHQGAGRCRRLARGRLLGRDGAPRPSTRRAWAAVAGADRHRSRRLGEASGG